MPSWARKLWLAAVFNPGHGPLMSFGPGATNACAVSPCCKVSMDCEIAAWERYIPVLEPDNHLYHCLASRSGHHCTDTWHCTLLQAYGWGCLDIVPHCPVLSQTAGVWHCDMLGTRAIERRARPPPMGKHTLLRTGGRGLRSSCLMLWLMNKTTKVRQKGWVDSIWRKEINCWWR